MADQPKGPQAPQGQKPAGPAGQAPRPAGAGAPAGQAKRVAPVRQRVANESALYAVVALRYNYPEGTQPKVNKDGLVEYSPVGFDIQRLDTGKIRTVTREEAYSISVQHGLRNANHSIRKSPKKDAAHNVIPGEFNNTVIISGAGAEAAIGSPNMAKPATEGGNPPAGATPAYVEGLKKARASRSSATPKDAAAKQAAHLAFLKTLNITNVEF
jgi:hypothetical protein